MKKQLLLATFCIFGALQIGAQDNNSNNNKDDQEQTFFDKRVRPYVEKAKVQFGKAKTFIVDHKMELLAGATACVAAIIILKSFNARRQIAMPEDVSATDVADNNTDAPIEGDVVSGFETDSDAVVGNNTDSETLVVLSIPVDGPVDATDAPVEGDVVPSETRVRTHSDAEAGTLESPAFTGEGGFGEEDGFEMPESVVELLDSAKAWFKGAQARVEKALESEPLKP